MKNSVICTMFNLLIVITLAILIVFSPSTPLTLVFLLGMYVFPFIIITITAASNHKYTHLYEKTINCHLGVGVLVAGFWFFVGPETGYGLIPSHITPFVLMISGAMITPFAAGRIALRYWDTYRLWV